MSGQDDIERDRYDGIVIGTGQGGKPLARALAGAGRQVAIVEADRVGGTCVNVGCTPTKAMVASAKVAWLAGRAGDYGVQVEAPSVDMEKVRERKRAIVESFRSGSRERLEATDGVDLIFGHARFTALDSLAVELPDGATRRLQADEIFINTGCRPLVPPIDGLDGVDWLDNETIMELDTLPDHLLVIGGGYIGIEFAQMFRRFGSEVTIVQRGSQLLGHEDEDVAEAVAEILEDEGITVLLDTTARAVAADDQGIALEVEDPAGSDEPGSAGNDGGAREAGDSRRLRGSHLLVATGRRPNTDDLGLERAGVETDDRGFVVVDGRLRTSVPGIWALGDVKGGPMFTHISYDDHRVIVANLLDGDDASTEGRPIPYTVYMDPELGRVGLTERQAQERGVSYQVAKLPMSHVARALERDETRGFMKAIVDAESGRILGCAILGVEGGEIMSVLQVAMMGELPYTAIRDGIFAHPTLAESLNNLFMTLG